MFNVKEVVRRDKATKNYPLSSEESFSVFQFIVLVLQAVAILVHSPQCLFQMQQSAVFSRKAQKINTLPAHHQAAHTQVSNWLLNEEFSC